VLTFAVVASRMGRPLDPPPSTSSRPALTPSFRAPPARDLDERRHDLVRQGAAPSRHAGVGPARELRSTQTAASSVLAFRGVLVAGQGEASGECRLG
jgi:hypothetical protein